MTVLRANITWQLHTGVRDGDGREVTRPIASTLTWTDTDPLVVEVTYRDPHDGHAEKVWLMGRDQLACMAPSIGDVRITRGPGHVLTVHLSSPDGDARLSTDVRPVDRFLTSTFNRAGLADEIVTVAEAADRMLKEAAE